MDPSTIAPQDVQATFCATLVDEWIELGVRHVIVAPGSRSTPMALAVATRPELHVEVFHDERVASFVALGVGVADANDSGIAAVPALLLCTSGTAAANFLPAVVEAGLSGVPMIVLTADRPEELRGVGAPQTIDQVELFGSHVRAFAEPDVPAVEDADRWRRLAEESYSATSIGPVHLNLAFREPLIGTPQQLPPRRQAAEGPGDPWLVITDPTPADEAVPEGLIVERGVVLAGGAHGQNSDLILELGRLTGWPIVADASSGLRSVADVACVDALLRDTSFVSNHRPDVIIRIGRPAASKVLAQWTHEIGAKLVQVGGPGRIDPARDIAARCSLPDVVAAARRATGDIADASWRAAWIRADALVQDAWRSLLVDVTALSEPAVARTIADHLPADALLTVSSSMPVRDLEWFGGSRARAHSNRGANGIDGVISTAIGRGVATDRTSFVLIGDLAFVHDSNALVALAQRGVDLRVVVVDNDGGGIFSFLPQATDLTSARFEQLFGTPLAADVLMLASAHGIATSTAVTRGELVAQLEQRGPWVCRVPSERPRNVEDHEALHAAGLRALGTATS